MLMTDVLTLRSLLFKLQGWVSCEPQLVECV